MRVVIGNSKFFGVDRPRLPMRNDSFSSEVSPPPCHLEGGNTVREWE